MCLNADFIFAGLFVCLWDNADTTSQLRQDCGSLCAHLKSTKIFKRWTQTNTNFYLFKKTSVGNDFQKKPVFDINDIFVISGQTIFSVISRNLFADFCKTPPRRNYWQVGYIRLSPAWNLASDLGLTKCHCYQGLVTPIMSINQNIRRQTPKGGKWM